MSLKWVSETTGDILDLKFSQLFKPKGFGYRFGFNGKEQDSEVSGQGNSYDFGARIYDSRLGRWFKTDPMAAKYCNLSPYNYVQNSPIIFVDKDGREIDLSKIIASGQSEVYNAMLTVLMESEIFTEMYRQLENSDQVIQINLVEGRDGKMEHTSAKDKDGNRHQLYIISIPLGGETNAEAGAQELFHSYQRLPANSLLRLNYTDLDYESEGEIFTFVVSKEIRSGEEKIYNALANPYVHFTDGRPIFEKSKVFEELSCGTPTVEQMASKEFNKMYDEYKIFFEKEAIQRRKNALFKGLASGPYDKVIGDKSVSGANLLINLVNQTNENNTEKIINETEIHIDLTPTKDSWK